jgi:hypothetical protein
MTAGRAPDTPVPPEGLVSPSKTRSELFRLTAFARCAG